MKVISIFSFYVKYLIIILDSFYSYSYGLLGPSGCGKTTLLSCMVGRCQLDAGDIQVKARTKSNIGYMPQVTSN